MIACSPAGAASSAPADRRGLGAQQQQRLVEIGVAAGEDVDRAHPDRLRPQLRLQRRLERRGPVLRRQRRQPAGEIGRLGAEGVVEGVDPPDRPGDQPAEQPQRLGLGAEPRRIADHLVADQPGGDQVGQRGGRAIGGMAVHGLGPSVAARTAASLGRIG